jgi:hypothetical protein
MPKADSLSRAVWIGQANCKSADLNLFFPEDGRTFGKEIEALCAECPVIEPCQEWAIYHEPYGYQGGLTPRQREKVRARLRIYVHEPQTNLMPKGQAS